MDLKIPMESLDRFLKMIAIANEYASPRESEFCLDVGCGQDEGIFAVNEKLKMQSVNVGLDPQANSYKLRKPCKMVPITGIGEELPFKNHALDVIFCINVLDHTAIPVKTINEIYRVTKKKGLLFLMTHVVSPKRKAVFQIFHSNVLVKQLFHPLTENRYVKKVLVGVLKILGLIFREKFYSVYVDGYSHPHYFTDFDVSKLLRKSGYSIIKEKIMNDVWKLKFGAYYICSKAET
jgi:ubiquinone/menaquinone biosynthesis C-methylase UbiE